MSAAGAHESTGQLPRAGAGRTTRWASRSCSGSPGLHPGQQTDVKRALRELVREGAIHKEGKRFFVAGGSQPEPTWAAEQEAAPGPAARDAAAPERRRAASGRTGSARRAATDRAEPPGAGRRAASAAGPA